MCRQWTTKCTSKTRANEMRIKLLSVHACTWYQKWAQKGLYILVASVCDTTVLCWIQHFRLAQWPPRSCWDPLKIVTNGTLWGDSVRWSALGMISLSSTWWSYLSWHDWVTERFEWPVLTFTGLGDLSWRWYPFLAYGGVTCPDMLGWLTGLSDLSWQGWVTCPGDDIPF